MIFAYARLREFLHHLRSHYPVLPLGQWQGERAAILRHDVDFDLESAARLAELEQDCGLSSTFFVLCDSAFYNPAARASRERLRRILEAGCEVGLHFDPPESDLEAHARRQADWLGNLVGREIRSLSLHNPHRLTGEYPLVPGFLNAYDPRIFQPDRYLSDSCLRFRHDPFEFVARPREGPLQILLHPVHYSEEGGGYAHRFSSLLGRFLQELDGNVRPYNATYAAEIQPELLTWFRAGAPSPRTHSS
ncbi:MAG: hypothetical protein AB1758_11585 [Candidatus Eremiobacterota bacterium]